MKINITEKDIENGQAENIQECAVALALKRTLKSNNVEVHCDHKQDTFWFEINRKHYKQEETDKPEHINNFIHWFDTGIMGIDGCKPFEFELKI